MFTNAPPDGLPEAVVAGACNIVHADETASRGSQALDYLKQGDPMSVPQPSVDELRSLLDAEEVEMSVVFSDPSLPDNPMIYVSEEFERQTGYSAKEAFGRNCRFLQGQDTSPNAVEAIRQALRARTVFSIDILNYRKNGTPFMNRLRIRPIFDERGELRFFVGAQNPV
jgi:PAS domain S-box-containing protein